MHSDVEPVRTCFSLEKTGGDIMETVMQETKINCWEFKRCGREPGGENASEGVCPVAIEQSVHGVHHGENAGRCCWLVADVLLQQKIICRNCDFYHSVRNDEVPELKVTAVSDRYSDRYV